MKASSMADQESYSVEGQEVSLILTVLIYDVC